MSREEEKYKAATESWDKQGFKNQGQKIPYKLGFLEGFDYADQHPKKGLWDAEKVINFLKERATLENSSNINIYINGATYHFVNDFIEDLHKAMEDKE